MEEHLGVLADTLFRSVRRGLRRRPSSSASSLRPANERDFLFRSGAPATFPSFDDDGLDLVEDEWKDLDEEEDKEKKPVDVVSLGSALSSPPSEDEEEPPLDGHEKRRSDDYGDLTKKAKEEEEKKKKKEMEERLEER